MSENIAIFGGKFDPPHLAHQLTVFLALEKYGMDEVWIFPSAVHPFGYESSDFEYRFNMCRIMARPWDENKVKVMRTEQEISTGTVYTVDLLRHLKAIYPAFNFHLLIGADNWSVKEKWRNFSDIEKLCKSIIVTGRGENINEGFSLPGISSTQIRDMLKNGSDPSPLLPRGIIEYIRNQNLYL